MGSSPAATGSGGEGAGWRRWPSRPPPAGGTSGEAQQLRERAVICGAACSGELDLGHGSEGEVV
jgi:hypothetical protein